MKFKELINTKEKAPTNRLRIIISESQLKAVIHKLTDEQIQNKINEHNSLKSKPNGTK
jgi:hypothetical protein